MVLATVRPASLGRNRLSLEAGSAHRVLLRRTIGLIPRGPLRRWPVLPFASCFRNVTLAPSSCPSSTDPGQTLVVLGDVRGTTTLASAQGQDGCPGPHVGCPCALPLPCLAQASHGSQNRPGQAALPHWAAAQGAAEQSLGRAGEVIWRTGVPRVPVGRVPRWSPRSRGAGVMLDPAQGRPLPRGDDGDTLIPTPPHLQALCSAGRGRVGPGTRWLSERRAAASIQ